MALQHTIASAIKRSDSPPGGIVDVLVASKDGKRPAGLEHIPWKTRVLVDSRPGWANAANALLSQSAEAGHDAIFIDDDVTILPDTFTDFEFYYPYADVFGFRLRGQPEQPEQVGWGLQFPNPNPSAACYLAHITASLMYIRAGVLQDGLRFPVWPGIHFEDMVFTYECWVRGFAVAYVPLLALHDINPMAGAMAGATKRNEQKFAEKRAINHQLFSNWVTENNIRKAASDGQIPFGIWGISP